MPTSRVKAVPNYYFPLSPEHQKSFYRYILSTCILRSFRPVLFENRKLAGIHSRGFLF